MSLRDDPNAIVRTMTIRWERVADLRTPLLIIMAIAAVAVGLFQIPSIGTMPLGTVLGWVWIGVGLAFVAWAGDNNTGGPVR